MPSPCTEERRFVTIEDDIKDIKKEIRGLSATVISVQTDQAETKIYIKQIFERVDDLKELFTNGQDKNNKVWVTIVTKLIELVAIVGGIVAGVRLLS